MQRDHSIGQTIIFKDKGFRIRHNSSFECFQNGDVHHNLLEVEKQRQKYLHYNE